jgi:hypothetical protein
MLETNIGTWDRTLRILFGLVLIGLAVDGQIGPWGYLGLLPLLTGAVAICPLYQWLHIKTTQR